MTTIKISVQGRNEKHEFDFPEPFEAVSERIQNRIKDEKFLLFTGEGVNIIIPIHTVTMIEIFEED